MAIPCKHHVSCNSNTHKDCKDFLTSYVNNNVKKFWFFQNKELMGKCNIYGPLTDVSQNIKE